jgi:hypothetical protein
LLVFNIRNWMPVASVHSAISPPSASTSRTSCPFASPPIAGLHDMRPIASGSSTTIAVRQPSRAAAAAASTPACPPPITSTSKSRVTPPSITRREPKGKGRGAGAAVQAATEVDRA